MAGITIVRNLIIATALFVATQVAGQQAYIPQKGDLLFQEGVTGDFEEAIKAVTPAYQGKQFTHVAAITIEDGVPYVLEAITRGVVKTPYAEFLRREQTAAGKPKVVVGRIKPQYRYIVDSAISRMYRYLGKPYDSVFDLNNDSYYCSELIYKCYTDSAQQPIFTVNPMTFNDPTTGPLFKNWKTYFEALKQPVPEGAMGLNPGSMANEKVVDIIYSFY